MRQEIIKQSALTVILELQTKNKDTLRKLRLGSREAFSDIVESLDFIMVALGLENVQWDEKVMACGMVFNWITQKYGIQAPIWYQEELKKTHAKTG